MTALSLPLNVVLNSLCQTCEACPSQWEGYGEDGGFYFIHYRHGHLFVERDHELVFSLNVEGVGGADGVMDTDVMLRVTGLFLAEKR